MPESFVARRWSTLAKDYVDSKNQVLNATAVTKLIEKQTHLVPPADGSTPLLSLPTEVRLQIYAYLTEYYDDPLLRVYDRHSILRAHDGVNWITRVANSSGNRYVYWYRSPGRITNPKYLTKSMMQLFHVCQKLREELIDAYFSDKIFVVEASLYRKSSGGLCVLPADSGPAAWVRRLLVLTVVEVDGSIKGIGDLRSIQQMTSLRDLTIVFAPPTLPATSTHDLRIRWDDPIKALLQCVPKTTNVRVEVDEDFKRELRSHLGISVDYLFCNDRYREGVVEFVKDNMPALSETKGHLSGSTSNHAQCVYQICCEGLGCVNSRLRPGTEVPRAS